MRTVREIDAFYEVGGPHEVPRDRAEFLYTRATDVISRYVGGAVVLSSLRGARIPLGKDAPIDITKIRLSKEPHWALLTGRPTVTSKGKINPNGGRGTNVTGKGGSGGSGVVSTVTSRSLDASGMISLDVLLHELAHSFDADHCVDGPPCTLREDDGKIAPNITPEPLRRPHPFCDYHIEELEIAGYQNIATQLSAGGAATSTPQQSSGLR